MPTNNPLFITCSGGIEPLLIEELAELGFPNASEGYRGVYVQWNDIRDIYHLNYCSRLGGRILLPLTRFRCYDQKALYKGADSIDWSQFIQGNKSIAIDSNVSHNLLRNSLFAAQVVKDAICDQLRAKTGKRPQVDTKSPDIQLNLFIHDLLAIISFDTSGMPLHKRGYRQESVEAPLQETMAAAILRCAKYEGGEILYDPCCGSGTILTEAALIATKTPPGYLRKDWGFRYLPDFSQQEWLGVKVEADQLRKPEPAGKFFGTDVNKNAIRICKTNLRAAGMQKFVDVQHTDFRDYTPMIAPNFVVTNPPHGLRLDDGERLKPLYRALGDFMKRATAKPSRGFIFTGNLELAKEVGLAAKRRYVFDNSGIDSRLLEFDLY